MTAEHQQEIAGETDQRILQLRARALAQITATPLEDEERIELLEFTLGEEVFSIEAVFIREVLPVKEITRLPCVPAFVLGIINVRGQIHSVIDLRHFLGLAARENESGYKILLLRTPEMELGIVADTVVGIRSLPLPELQPPPVTFNGGEVEYLKGVTPDRVLVLNAVRLLADKRLLVHEEVTG